MEKRSIVLLIVLMLVLLAGCAPKDDPAPPADADIETIALDLVTDLSDGDFAAAADDYAYVGKMRGAISEKFLKEQVWEYLVTNYGAFEGFGEPVMAQTGDYETVAVPASFEKGVVNMNITFDDSKLIAGIHSVPVE
jgi:hypothetical protein